MITRIGGQAPWEARYGYCRVVRAGRWAITAGTTATGPDGVLHRGDAYAQTLAAFGIALRALAEAGVSADDVVRTRMYVVDIGQQEAIGQAHSELFGRVRPVATMVEVSALISPDLLVEIEVDAYLDA